MSPSDGQFWYAVYARSRHEKAAERELRNKGLETFLPLVEVPRRWSDRWKTVSLPLFPGYLFVRMPQKRRLDVLTTRGVCYLVGDTDGPVPVREEDLEAVKLAIESELHLDAHPFLSEGQRVRVVRGPLRGCEGILLRKKSRYRLVLSVELIRKSMALEIDAADVSAA